MMNSIHETLKERTDRAVSPVIGVILMVAITVILAAVIGTFVLDLGQSAGNAAPQASLSVDAETSTDNVTINHEGGDGLDAQQTRLTITNESTGDSQTYEPASSADVLSVGGSVAVSTDTQNIVGTWSGMTASGTSFAIGSGFQYTVQLIDTESQRVIFETTITA